MSMRILLRAVHLGAHYGGKEFLHDIDFNVPAGQIIGVLGVNGAGKTTLFKRILGILPGPGQVHVLNRECQSGVPGPHEVGVVWDNLAAHPGIHGDSLLKAWCRSLRLSRIRAIELLKGVGLSDIGSRRVGQLSLGMRQRLSLAMALAPRPRILVMDEPTNGLDPSGIRWLNSVITDFTTAGGAVLLSSHQLAQVELLAHRVLLIEQGKLVLDQSLRSFIATLSAPRLRICCSTESVLKRKLIACGATVESDNAGELLVSDCERSVVAKLAYQFGGIISLFTEESVTLEESFHDFLNNYREGLE